MNRNEPVRPDYRTEPKKNMFLVNRTGYGQRDNGTTGQRDNGNSHPSIHPLGHSSFCWMHAEYASAIRHKIDASYCFLSSFSLFKTNIFLLVPTSPKHNPPCRGRNFRVSPTVKSMLLQALASHFLSFLQRDNIPFPIHFTQTLTR